MTNAEQMWEIFKYVVYLKTGAATRESVWK